MKKLIAVLFSLLIGMLSYANEAAENLVSGFITGNAEVQSINALDFGPEGILFIGDSQSGTVVAIETEKSKSDVNTIEFKQIDQLLSSLLGTPAKEITINDMAINPISKKVYLAVSTQNGSSLLLRSEGDTFVNVDLTNVSFSSTSLTDPIGVNAKDRRGRSMRRWAISDLQYFQGNIMVTGLSNAEFSSSLRSIAFPFKDKQSYGSLEIYHAAHGQYETHSPIKTFMPYMHAGKNYVVASYTCTPLVLFDLDQMKSGTHTKGKTVAELGNRNSPLDIISYTKDGKEYLLMANTSRALMKIDPEKVMSFPASLDTPVMGSGTDGISFINLPYVNVLQLDKLNDEYVVAIQRRSNGDLDLMTINNSRL